MSVPHQVKSEVLDRVQDLILAQESVIDQIQELELHYPKEQVQDWVVMKDLPVEQQVLIEQLVILLQVTPRQLKEDRLFRVPIELVVF